MSLLFRVFRSKWREDNFPKYPRVLKGDFREWNNKMFKKYNNERVYNHINPLIRYIERVRVKAVIELLSPIKKEDFVLAAGCGEGYIEKQLPDSNLVLVDLSEEAIKRAKKNLKNRINVEYFIQDLEKLPFSDETFNKTECSEVIEHVLSPQSLLKELRRTLKQDGFLVVTFPNEPLINLLKKIFIKLRIFNIFFPNISEDMTEEWHLHAFSFRHFESVIKDEWQILTVKGVPYNFFPLRYVVKCRKS